MGAEAEQVVLWAVGVVALLSAMWWIASVAAWVWALRSCPNQNATTPNATTQNGASPGSWTMPGSRGLARAVLAPSLLLTGLTASCTGGADPEVPTLVWVDEPTTNSSIPDPALPTTAPPTTALTTTAPPTTAPPTTAPPTTAEDQGATNPGFVEQPIITHVVSDGEHLWAIAAEHLAGQTGSQPTNQQIASYWRQLIERNRSSLFSGDPDLIHTGEVLVLP